MNDPLELAAIERGAGAPVALVHGGVIHAGPAWARNIAPLADAGFRVIAVDRRGHGRSEAGDAELVPVHLHADDLRLTLELRDAREAHLVGVSYGALVCLEFALSWPDRVRSMTLLEPPLITWLEGDPDYHVWFEGFEEVEREALAGMPLEEWVPRWLSLIDTRLARDAQPESKTWPLIQRQAPLIFTEEPGWRYRPEESAVGSLDVPALILTGDRSEPPMQEIGERLALRLPRGSHVWIEGGGHDSHARKAPAFNALVIDFLAKHDIDS